MRPTDADAMVLWHLRLDGVAGGCQVVEETFGRYRLLERLGQGGMAEVFKAKSFGVEGFEKVLVIKRILPELANNSRFVDMFVHEAKLAVRLSHANIVQVFDLGKVSNPGTSPSYFIAMEYVAGLDLASLLSRARRRGLALPIGLCVYVTAEIAKGLDHAHRRRDEHVRPLGIVHRDVSPQNVLLSWEGEVKVTDFGIAKARDVVDGEHGDKRFGQLKGKYAYMSPEQARGMVVDARSDIFALGTVFYELLAGVNPFSAATPFETLRRVQAAEYPPVEVLRQDVAAELASIVRKSLAQRMQERFDNAGRLYEELLAFMYSSATRFGANDLSKFLTEFRETDVTELDAADVLEDKSHATADRERTPLEVPQNEQSQDGSTTGRSSFSDVQMLLGERREVTALVLAFGGREASLQSQMRARVKDTLARYGARLIDEEPLQLVALFGLGDSDGRDTEIAVRCALVLLRQLSAGRLVPSAGIHVGRIVLHPSGEPARDARLGSIESQAQELARITEGRCAVSAAAARHVRTMFVLEPLPETARATSVSTGSLIGELRAADDALGKFVGRRNQLRRMGEVLAAATRRHLRIVTVYGEQGVGKTRFMYEVERRLRKGEYNVGLYVACCPPRGKEVPFAGLTAMLQVLCGIAEGDPVERVLGVEPRLRALGLPDEERNAVLGQLGAPRSGQSGPNLPPLRAAFARMVMSLCEDRLHVFTWDNAQALDEETIDVLSAASSRLSNVRAVFILTTRTEQSHSLSCHAAHETIEIGELSEEETTRLIALRAGLPEAPEELVSFCRQRAGGHPLFIEELIKELIDTKAIVMHEGTGPHLRLTGDIATPRTLRSLLTSRIARLDTEQRAVVRGAAILSDSVDSSVLASMLGLSLHQLDRALGELERTSLIRRVSASALALGSTMVRDAVIDSLAADAVRNLHGAAAAAYELVFGPRAEQEAHQIAHHLYEAGNRNRAATFFALSGKRRLQMGQVEACVQDMLRAIDLAALDQRTATELCRWLKDLRSALHRVRVAPALGPTLAHVMTRLDEDGNARQRVLGRTSAAAILGSVNQFAEANAYIEAALALASDDPRSASVAHITGGELLMRQGHFRRAMEHLERVKAPEALDHDDAYRFQITMAHVLGATGGRELGLSHLDRAIAMSDVTDLALAVEHEKVRGMLCYYAEDFAGATAAFERGADTAKTVGLSFEVAVALHNLGDALIWQGSFARAYASFRESENVSHEFGYDRLLTLDRMYMAYLEAEKGQAEATEALRGFIDHTESKGYVGDAVQGRYLLACLAFERRDRSMAQKELTTVRDVASKTQRTRLAARASAMLEEIQEWSSSDAEVPGFPKPPSDHG